MRAQGVAKMWRGQGICLARLTGNGEQIHWHYSRLRSDTMTSTMMHNGCSARIEHHDEDRFFTGRAAG
jgi:hypothetical protein